MKKLILPLLLISLLAFARTKDPIQSYRPAELKVHNINQVEMTVSNYGKFGQDETGDIHLLMEHLGLGKGVLAGG